MNHLSKRKFKFYKKKNDPVIKLNSDPEKLNNNAIGNDVVIIV